MNMKRVIERMFPGSDMFSGDFEVRDDLDGKGAYISIWNIDSPQPTHEEMEAVWSQIVAEDEQRQTESKTETELLQQRIAELEKQNKLLEAQKDAIADRADFHEELIAEIAMMVYQ